MVHLGFAFEKQISKDGQALLFEAIAHNNRTLGVFINFKGQIFVNLDEQKFIYQKELSARDFHILHMESFDQGQRYVSTYVTSRFICTYPKKGLKIIYVFYISS